MNPPSQGATAAVPGLPGREALVSSERLARALAEHLPLGILVAGRGGEVEFVNRCWCELAGLTPEQSLGNGWATALHPEDAERVVAIWASASASGVDARSDFRLLRPDGSTSFVESRLAAIRDGDGAVTGWVGTCVELTGHAPPAPSDDRFRVAFAHAPVGTALLNPDGSLLEVNGAFCRLLGYAEEELRAINLVELTVPNDAAADVDDPRGSRSETRYLRADGSSVWVSASTALVRDGRGDPLYYVVQIEDIGDRKQTERELRRLADHDALTGLLNRRGFMDGLRRELRRMERKGEYGALLLLDLDNFKTVNDTAGHLAGDQVLRTTADILRGRLRATDVIGRLGGDEFAALVLNVTPRQAADIAEETTDAIRALTVTAGAVQIEVAASIGVVAIDELRNENEEELLAAADRAMYRAKSLRRD